VTAFVPGAVTVRVPATSANLGPGFDCLGLALTMYDELTATVLPDADPVLPRITVEGEGAGSVPTDASHLVHRAMVAGFAAMGVATPGVRLDCRNVVPHGRGLGSSSAAIVGGLAVARALVTDGAARLNDAALFELAAGLEGHPDNVAPAVFGGFTIAYDTDGGARAVRLEVDPALGFVALVPTEPLATEVARGLLPGTVPHVDAATNAGRAALLVAALTGRASGAGVLLDATEDLLHQGYRAAAMAGSASLLAALRAEGIAAVVSGAGPTVLAIVPAAQAPEVAALAPRGWRGAVLVVDPEGVRILTSGVLR